MVWHTGTEYAFKKGQITSGGHIQVKKQTTLVKLWNLIAF